MVRSNYKSRSDFVTAVFDKYQLKMQTIACGILHDTHLSEDAVFGNYDKNHKKC